MFLVQKEIRYAWCFSKTINLTHSTENTLPKSNLIYRSWELLPHPHTQKTHLSDLPNLAVWVLALKLKKRQFVFFFCTRFFLKCSKVCKLFNALQYKVFIYDLRNRTEKFLILLNVFFEHGAYCSKKKCLSQLSSSAVSKKNLSVYKSNSFLCFII